MFERFSREARTAVALAQEDARRSHASEVHPEHLLLGVLNAADDPAVRTLADHGITLASARRSLGAAADHIDAEALQSIGIDFEAIRRSVEETFGSGALSNAGRRTPRHYGHIPLTAETKQTLAQALRATTAVNHRTITPAHLLTGLLRAAPHSPAAALLTTHGITEATLT